MKNSDGPDRMASISNDFKNVTENISGSRIGVFFMIYWLMRQVWDWLFKSCKVNIRILFRNCLIDVKDIEECIVKGRCKKLAIKLPAWSIWQCLLASAKSKSSGLVICLSVLICVHSDRLDPLPKPPRFVIAKWRRQHYLGSQVGLIQQMVKLCTR
nr:uncharacterized membrane protein At3g27390 isoform X1 [Tanacetum cinerariifolium]